MEIRKATLEDLKSIQELCSSLFDYEYNESGDKSLDLNWIFGEAGEEYLRNAITNNDCCTFVAVEDGKVVGYIEGGIMKMEEYRKISKMVRLESFYISEDFRKKGIGEKLYTAFVDWVKKKGVRNISVEITTANKGAESFYKKNGFRDYNSTLEVEL